MATPGALTWECDALLADGGTIHVRPISTDDGEKLIGLHSRLSPESIYRRYFSAHPRLSPAEIEHYTHIDRSDRMALVATLKDQIVAVARYERSAQKPEEAEVAFLVDDAHQGRGIGTLLLEHLAAFARTRGIRVFSAETLPDNHPMQTMFRQAGFQERTSFTGGVIDVRMDIAPTTSFVDAVEGRSRHAAVESIRRLLCPRSVAVIGVSRSRGTIGHELFRNLLAGDFQGPVYPVHPSAKFVAGVRAYPTITEVPDTIDLAVIVVRADQTPEVLDQCGAKGVKGVVVITAGFAESGDAGRSVQDRMVQRARGAGMRMVGPNCMGVINTAHEVSLNATFAPIPPRPGRVAFASQSGGLGIAVLEEVKRRGIGISSFVSMGNKADVSGNDLLQYWEQDAGTDVILMYLESFGNPRRFARIARQVSRSKPIVAVKAGRTGSGRRAASSHTAAMASADTAVDALFRQAGVIRVDTLEELFDVGQVLSTQPIPRGRRIAIVGNAGGPGILAADACEAAGLLVPELSESVQDQLRSFLPPAASIVNPVDMVASASAENYERTLKLVLGDERVDAVLAVFVPPLVTNPDDVAAAISRAAKDAIKPVVAVFLGLAEAPASLTSPTKTVPNFAFPEPAARALARACGYGEWRCRPAGQFADLAGIDTATAVEIVGKALSDEPQGTWLGFDQGRQLLGTYGIAVVPAETVSSHGAAVKAAGRIGYPVALKAGGTTVLHKTEQGGVKLSLRSAAELRDAYDQMEARLGEAMQPAIVEAMAEPGVETIVGVVHDPSFGPLVMFGTGGTSVELFGDRGFRILPMTDLDADDLVRSTKGSALLFGYRGAPAVDVSAVESLLLRVARLADDIPQIAELDLNPVIVNPSGAIAVDFRIRVAPSEPGPDPTVRRLR